MSEQQPTPAADDLGATVPEVIARAQQDYAQAQAAAQAKEAHGGSGIREGILPGGDL